MVEFQLPKLDIRVRFPYAALKFRRINMKKKLDRTKVYISKPAGKATGRGFSLGELKKASMSVISAKLKQIPVDIRRKSTHDSNVETLISLNK